MDEANSKPRATTLYFIKGDNDKNWGAMKMRMTKNATNVIDAMEKDGWKCVTASAFHSWRKRNSRPTLHAPDAANAAAELALF